VLTGNEWEVCKKYNGGWLGCGEVCGVGVSRVAFWSSFEGFIVTNNGCQGNQ